MEPFSMFCDNFITQCKYPPPPVSIGHSFDRLISYVMIIQDSLECIISTCLHFCRCLITTWSGWSGVRQRVKHGKWIQKSSIAVITWNGVEQWPRFRSTFAKFWNVVGWFTIIDTLHAILTESSTEAVK